MKALPFPMPNDVIFTDDSDTGMSIVVASVEYIDDGRGKIALVILLEKQSPFFTVAYYALTDFDPTKEHYDESSDGCGTSYTQGQLDVISRCYNIVEAVEAYEDNGGEY